MSSLMTIHNAKDERGKSKRFRTVPIEHIDKARCRRHFHILNKIPTLGMKVDLSKNEDAFVWDATRAQHLRG